MQLKAAHSQLVDEVRRPELAEEHRKEANAALPAAPV
jgi:hypothetical protein